MTFTSARKLCRVAGRWLINLCVDCVLYDLQLQRGMKDARRCFFSRCAKPAGTEGRRSTINCHCQQFENVLHPQNARREQRNLSVHSELFFICVCTDRLNCAQTSLEVFAIIVVQKSSRAQDVCLKFAITSNYNVQCLRRQLLKLCSQHELAHLSPDCKPGKNHRRSFRGLSRGGGVSPQRLIMDNIFPKRNQHMALTIGLYRDT